MVGLGLIYLTHFRNLLTGPISTRNVKSEKPGSVTLSMTLSIEGAEDSFLSLLLEGLKSCS
jgi:hypothetical protein